MLSCTPRSTLFPYTTLFRSFVEGSSDLIDIFHRVVYRGPELAPIEIVDQLIGRIDHAIEFICDGLHIDRKSTRLNSSHVRISYAVFCLKKKNNIIIEYTCII